jgi:hypothetical protein
VSNTSQILRKAVERAEHNGWMLPDHVDSISFTRGVVQPDDLMPYDVSTTPNTLDILYNHDFAKALWGENMVQIDTMFTEMGNKFPVKQAAWQYHLQQMVITDDPIAYLGEHLPDEQKQP